MNQMVDMPLFAAYAVLAVITVCACGLFLWTSNYLETKISEVRKKLKDKDTDQ